jgi:nucleoside-diphosphate-sugar epimerase
VNNFSGCQVLVTGGNGAVGSNLVRKLLDLDAKVTVLDDFSQSARGNLSVDKKLDIIHGNIVNSKILDKVFNKKYDYVFHLAARFANEMSVNDPMEDLRINIQGTMQVLLKASRQNPERFVYTSSSSIYGHQKTSIFSEKTIPLPSTPYASSKLSGEHYCNAIHELYGLDYAIVRLSNSYGPFDPPGKFRNVIPNFMLNAINGKDLTIFGTGKETRDFTYVDDCVDGILLSAVKQHKNQVFNLGTGKETTIKKVADIILDLTQHRSKIVYRPMRTFDHIKRRRMDISKTQRLLNYKPVVKIETGLAKTYEWFLNR